MAWQLSAPAAVAGLVAAAQTVTGPEVMDGLVVTASTAKEVIVVAGSSDKEPADHPFIEHKLPEPGYRDDVTDSFTIYSDIAVLDADANAAAGRTRAYQILADWEHAINADPTLGDAVLAAWVSGVAYHVQQARNGAKTVLIVAIDCEAATGL